MLKLLGHVLGPLPWTDASDRMRLAMSLLYLVVLQLVAFHRADAQPSDRVRSREWRPSRVSLVAVSTELSCATVIAEPRFHLSPRQRQRLTVGIVGLALFNDVLLLLMLVPVLPSLVAQHGIAPDDMRLAVLFSAKDACQMCCAPLAAGLTMRAGASASLSLSLLGLWASTIAFAEAHGFPQLLLARALQGATSAALMSGGLTLVAQTHLPAERSVALAHAHSGLGIGAALGPVLGGLLVERCGRRATFHIAAALVLLTALAQLVLTIAAPPSLLSLPSDIPTNSIPSVNIRRQFVSLLATRDIALATAAITGAYAAGGLFDAMFGSHVRSQFGMGPAKASRLFSIEPLTYLLLLWALAPLAGVESTRWSKPRLSALGLALTGLSLPLLTIGGARLGPLLLALVLHGVGYACKDAVGHALLAELVDLHRVGSYATVYALARGRRRSGRR